MMKRLLTAPALPLMFAIIPLMAAGSLRAQTPAAATAITVTFDTGGKSGVVMAALYDEAAYAGRGAPLQRERADAADGAARIAFPAVSPGRYAVKAFLDVNGDGKLNRNPFGMPTEPFGFSNGAVPRMGEPGWDEAGFDAPAGAVAHAIALR
jgi:uncharacterized protein (DUF2141 family)